MAYAQRSREAVKSSANDSTLRVDFELPAGALDLFAGALADVGTLGFEECAATPGRVTVRVYFAPTTVPGAVMERLGPWLDALEAAMPQHTVGGRRT